MNLPLAPRFGSALMTDSSPHPQRLKIPRAALMLVALGPTLLWFARRLDDGNDEPLGLLTLALCLALGWRDRKVLGSGPRARMAGAGLLIISVAGVPFLPPMIRAGIGLVAVALVYGIHRRPGLVGLLLLSLPLVASMQFFLGYPLRIAAAEGTVRLLELASVSVSRVGTQVELAGQVIGVDPACGGIRMLWAALAAAMGLAAIHRLSWRATVIAGLMAVGLGVPANTVRAALLVVQETGGWHGILPGHEAVGVMAFLVVLVPLWLAISSRAKPAVAANPESGAMRGVEGILLWIAAGLALLMVLLPPRAVAAEGSKGVPEVFTFDGMSLPLHPLPATPEEIAFAQGFPGMLASCRWGERQVILRRVQIATRRLHPSRDCLRAAGFETSEAKTVTLSDGSTWSRFSATRDGLRRIVHERLISEADGTTWTDVSSWYWSAMWHPLNGPWRAESIIGE